MALFDTHCHLNAEDFKDDVKGYVERANQVGVHFLAVIGWDLVSSKKALDISSENDNIFAVIGIHPSDVFKAGPNDLVQIEQLVINKQVVAIGEIGLDYYWNKDKAEHEIQKKWFIDQINLANKYNLPIVIHMRDASQDTLDLLKLHPVKKGGIMHCYSASSEMAPEFIKLGFYISLGGPVTFKNAKEPKKVAEVVPLDRLLIETDSPYLAPHPYRGKANESSYLPLVLNEIASIRGISPDELEKQLLINSFKVFHVEQK